MTDDLYAVVEHMQWRGPYDDGVTFHDSQDEALAVAAELTAEQKTQVRPSRFVAYRMEPVEEN